MQDLNQRLSFLDEKLALIEKREAEGFNSAQRTIDSVQASVSMLTASLERLEERIANEVKALPTAEALAQESRKVVEEEVRCVYDDPSSISYQIAEISTGLQLAEEKFEAKITALRSQVEATVHSLQKRSEETLSQVHNEMRKRELAEESLLRLVEETCTALQRELAEERRLRKESQKRIERALGELMN